MIKRDWLVVGSIFPGRVHVGPGMYGALSARYGREWARRHLTNTGKADGEVEAQIARIRAMPDGEVCNEIRRLASGFA